MMTWILVCTVLAVQAQIVDPVHFTSELKTGDGAEAEIIFHATIDNGWHVYSTELGDDGPIEATFNVVKMDGAEPVGKLIPKGKVIKKMDKLFDLELKFFENEATFVQKIQTMRSTVIWNTVPAAMPVVCRPRRSPLNRRAKAPWWKLHQNQMNQLRMKNLKRHPSQGLIPLRRLPCQHPRKWLMICGRLSRMSCVLWAQVRIWRSNRYGGFC